MPTNPRACAGSSSTQPSTWPSSKPSIGSPSWVNALLNAGVSQHQRALIAHCRGGWGIVGRGGVGHRCVVVWLWVCGCAGVWEVFIMYGCTLAREGKTTGPSTPFNMLPFSPPWRRTGRRDCTSSRGLSKSRPGDVLPHSDQGEKVSSRRPFQRGSRETEGMLHAE